MSSTELPRRIEHGATLVSPEGHTIQVTLGGQENVWGIQSNPNGFAKAEVIRSVDVLRTAGWKLLPPPTCHGPP